MINLSSNSLIKQSGEQISYKRVQREGNSSKKLKSMRLVDAISFSAQDSDQALNNVSKKTFKRKFDSKIFALNDCQNQLRIKRAYREFKEDHGIDIEQASKHNFAAVKKRLKLGKELLLQSISSSSKSKDIFDYLNLPAGLICKKEDWQILLYEQEDLRMMMCQREAGLFDFALQYFTFLHQTHDLDLIQKNGEALLSLTERERLGLSTDNGYTLKMDGRDNVFGTFGIGNHSTPDFLGNSGHIVKIDLHEAYKEKDGQQALKGLWVSGHFRDYFNQTINPPVILGTTRYVIKHDWQTKTKTYLYYHENGLVLERKVKMEEEVFAGNHVCPGIAYQLIEHLRFIGNPYREHILDLINGEAPLDVKLECLSAAMSTLMPGWIYPEAKVPVKINLKTKGVSIDSTQAIKTLKFNLDYKDFSKTALLDTEIKRSDFKFDQNDLSKSEIKILNDEERFKRILACLEIKTQDERDPMIYHLPDPNYKDQSLLLDILFIVCEKGDIAALRALIQGGADIQRRGEEFLTLAAQKGDLELFQILVDNGADPASYPFTYNEKPLDYFAKSGNLEGIDLAIQYGARVNQPYHFYHKSSILSTSSLDSEENGYTALHFAIKGGHVKAVEKLIAYGANINARAENGKTPYSLAIQGGQQEIIDLLLAKGANQDLTLAPYETCSAHRYGVALILTGLNRQREKVVILGQKHHLEDSSRAYLFPGGIQDLTDKSSFEAAIREFKEETGVDLTPFVKAPQKPLYIFETASQEFSLDASTAYYLSKIHYHTEIFHLDIGEKMADLVFHGKDDLSIVHKVKLSDLMFDPNAQALEKAQVVQKVLKYNANGVPIAQQHTSFLKMSNGLLLKAIVEEKKIDLSKAEIDYCMLIEHNGIHLLTQAIMDGDDAQAKKILNLLPKQPTSKLLIPLGAALEKENAGMVQLLIEKGASIEENPVWILERAFEHPHLLSLLLELDHLKTVEANQIRCLLAQVISKTSQPNFESIEFFLKLCQSFKSDTKVYQKTLSTAFGLSAERGNLQLVDLFIKYEADINFCGVWEYTKASNPLLKAVKGGHLEVVKHLMEKGANLNHISSPINAYNALMKALQYDRKKMALFFIETGIDLDYKNLDGLDAFQILEEMGPDWDAVKQAIWRKKYNVD